MSRTSTWNFAPTDTLRLPKVFKVGIEKIARAIDAGNGAEARAVLNKLLAEYEPMEAVIEEPQWSEFTPPVATKAVSSSAVEDLFLEDEPIPVEVLSQVFQKEVSVSSVTRLTETSALLEDDNPAAEPSASPEQVSSGSDLVTSSLELITEETEGTMSGTQEGTVMAVGPEVASGLTESIDPQRDAVIEQSIEPTQPLLEKVIPGHQGSDLITQPHAVTVNIADAEEANSNPDNADQAEAIEALLTEPEKTQATTESVVTKAPNLTEIIRLQTLVTTIEETFGKTSVDTDNYREEHVEVSESAAKPYSVTELQGQQKEGLYAVTEFKADTSNTLPGELTESETGTFEAVENSVTELKEALNSVTTFKTATPVTFNEFVVSSTAEKTLKKLEAIATQGKQDYRLENLYSVTETLNDSVTEPTTVLQDLPNSSESKVIETIEALPAEALPTPAEIEQLAEFGQNLFQTWLLLAQQRNRLNQEDCWGVNIGIELIYKEGFQSVSMHRFLNLLGSLAKAKAMQTYGHLHLSQKGSQESVTLNGVPVNKVAYYDPQKPLDLRGINRNQQTIVTASEEYPSKFEEARQAIAFHADQFEQHGKQTKRKEEGAANNKGLNILESLRRFLN
ncbi:hypothetical protein H6F86_13965 [Phormidium sp. FACHB-592]|uniref:Conserved oligomeric Golgi complex subunit 4 n=1 Tax=Stenomitos frigidus AS-A4 TaxID=2933935 RepID=A0ABV0KQX4_9CYAN|nr:hypothetical protein [Phormidium sp. FACHB-592]MBD2074980.1 hypothetical protein [Phormidium sp. FACHB-592]